MSVQDRVKHRIRSPREAAFVGLLVAAAHIQQQLEETCRKRGITHTQYNLLRILRGVHPEGHPRFEIANRLIARAPDVTRLLDRLERQGLVERGWGKGNRRHSVARIAKKGLALLRQIDPELDRIRDSTLAEFSNEQLMQLSRAFDMMVS